METPKIMGIALLAAKVWHAKHRLKSRKFENVAAQGNFAGL